MTKAKVIDVELVKAFIERAKEHIKTHPKEEQLIKGNINALEDIIFRDGFGVAIELESEFEGLDLEQESDFLNVVYFFRCLDVKHRRFVLANILNEIANDMTFDCISEPYSISMERIEQENKRLRELLGTELRRHTEFEAQTIPAEEREAYNKREDERIEKLIAKGVATGIDKSKVLVGKDSKQKHITISITGWECIDESWKRIATKLPVEFCHDAEEMCADNRLFVAQTVFDTFGKEMTVELGKAFLRARK